MNIDLGPWPQHDGENLSPVGRLVCTDSPLRTAPRLTAQTIIKREPDSDRHSTPVRRVFHRDAARGNSRKGFQDWSLGLQTASYRLPARPYYYCC